MLQKILPLTIICLFLALPASAYLPSDPLYNQQGYLDYINIRQAWDIAKGNGVVVAVLDSGVDINHPDLKFNIWKNTDEIAGDGIDNDRNGYIDDVNGWDFVDSDNDPSPVVDGEYDKLAISHGTAISGVISAVGNNGRGMIGVAFNSKIMPIRILEGNGEGFVDDLVAAIEYSIEKGADVINLSLVGDTRSQMLEEVIERAHKNGVVVVAAAGNTLSVDGGNDLDGDPMYPVCYGNSDPDTVVGVSSISSSGIKSSFSSYGSECVDVSALGEGISNLSYHDPDNGLEDEYSYNWAGTSFSTALVSGVAALIKSNNQSLTADQVMTALVSGSSDVDKNNYLYTGELGAGALDALGSLTADVGPLQGRLIKLENLSAVYYVNGNTRHLFSNEKVFFSWYRGSWVDQDIEIVLQDEFDSYSSGNNITIRPGTNLIKFQNSNRVYTVSTGGILHYASIDILDNLYDDHENRTIAMQNGFESDYKRGNPLDGSYYPSGTLIRYDDSSDIWYIDDNQKRKLENNAFDLNGFKDEYIVGVISPNFDYDIGRAVSNLNSDIFVYNL
jgi:hypothetical protein